jgi:hypothetical protein
MESNLSMTWSKLNTGKDIFTSLDVIFPTPASLEAPGVGLSYLKYNIMADASIIERTSKQKLGIGLKPFN